MLVAITWYTTTTTRTILLFLFLDFHIIVCEILSSVGTTVIVDLSYSPWPEAYQLARTHGIAYVRLERMLRPFLEMFADYMQQKRANNVAMIFYNARDTMEAVQHLLAGYPFRTMLLDASNTQPENFVERLHRLRPMPTYYAMFARGSAMNELFESVSNLLQVPHLSLLLFFFFRWKRANCFSAPSSGILCFWTPGIGYSNTSGRWSLQRVSRSTLVPSVARCRCGIPTAAVDLR